MIIVKYLVRETLKTQIAILFILFLIFFCQKLVKILSAAVEGDIPTTLVFKLLILGVPEMAQLILPLGLFLAILMTYGRLYIDSEMTAMQACGIGQVALLKSALILAFLTSIVGACNVLWFNPWSQQYQESVLAEAKANPGLASLAEGQFQKNSDGNIVLFVGDVDGNRFSHIFMAQLNAKGNQRPSVVVADTGTITQDSQGNQVVNLNRGSRYEGTASLKDFRLTDFVDYQAIIEHRLTAFSSSDTESMGFKALLANDSNRAKAELNWRLTMIIAIPLMAFLVVPLSEVNPRQGRAVSMLPAILLYLIYFLLQSSFKSNAMKGKLDAGVWMTITNCLYFLLAIALNLWDSVMIRRLRYHFKRG